MTDLRDRIVATHQALRADAGTSANELAEAAGADPEAVEADLAFMRQRLGAPIVEAEGRLYYDDTLVEWELPDLWLTPREVFDLLVARGVLADAGRIGPSGHIDAAVEAIDRALGALGYPTEVVLAGFDLKVFCDPVRHPPMFARAARALLERRCLDFDYRDPETGQSSHRTVEPQRLIFYRKQWFLLAWCREREGMRSFHLRGVQRASAGETCGEVASDDALEPLFDGGYGKLLLPSQEVARLRFNPHAAPRARHELWHKNQRPELEPDGSLILEVPYVDEGDIIAEVLRYGPDVEILWPRPLRAKLLARASGIVGLYQNPPPAAGGSLPPHTGE